MKFRAIQFIPILLAFLALPAMAEKKISILPFEVLSIRSEVKPLGEDISENLISALGNVPELYVTEISQNVMKELSLQPSGLNDNKNVIRVGKYLETEISISGTLEIDTDKFKANIKFINVKTGKQIKESLILAKDIAELQEKIAMEIITQQKVQINQAQKLRLFKITRATKSINALDYYIKGIKTLKLYAPIAYDNAVKLFGKALNEDRNFGLAIAAKAKAQALWSLQLKQDKNINYKNVLAEAQENLNNVIKMYPGLNEVPKILSIISYIEEDYEKGKKQARQAITLNFHDSEAYFLLWINSGANIEDSSLKTALKLNPFLPVIHSYIARSYQKEGRLDEAEQEYQEALKINPKNANLHYNIGIIYFKEGRLDEAITKFKESLKYSSDFWQAYNGLGISYKYQDKIDEAIKAYKESVKYNPDDAEAHLELGKIYTEAGELDDAIIEYKEALKINPNVADTHYFLGIVYKYRDNTEEAINEYKEAVKLKPNFSEAYYNLGIAYKYLGKLEEAISQYQNSIKINPDFVEARLNLGVAYFELNKLAEAINEYKEAIRIKPSYPRAHNNLGSAYQKQAKYDLAIVEYKEALKLNPNYSSVYNNLGTLYSEQGKTKDAEQAFKKACNLGYKPACKSEK